MTFIDVLDLTMKFAASIALIGGIALTLFVGAVFFTVRQFAKGAARKVATLGEALKKRAEEELDRDLDKVFGEEEVIDA